MNRKEAEKAIGKIKEQIDGLWKDCARIADESGVSFGYETPDSDYGGGTYYPPRPGDWVVFDEDRNYRAPNPNRDHPEFEQYHPWNDTDGYDRDWSEGHWVSSSSRC